MHQPFSFLLPLATACLAVSLLPRVGAESGFAFRVVNDSTGLELSEGGKPVFVHNYGLVLAPAFHETMRCLSYLHPVYALDRKIAQVNSIALCETPCSLCLSWP